MTPAEFTALCSDPASSLDDIVKQLHGRWPYMTTCLTLLSDERCVSLMRRVRHVHCDVEDEAFDARPLAFYLRYKDDVFAPWTPKVYTLVALLDYGTNAAEKVAYLLSVRHKNFLLTRYYKWRNIVASGLEHSDPAVRIQFPAVAPSIAIFLSGFPPRVQCRALENALVICW